MDEQPTQLTQPKEGDPIEIPIPERDEFERLVDLAATTPVEQDESDSA
jgi:hypothetical protein